MHIDQEQALRLLTLARETISQRLAGESEPVADFKHACFHDKAATFVTLKIENSLRGCIGSLDPIAPLWKSIRDNAINAAFHDQRFAPLTKKELAQVHIELSILSQPQLLNYVDSEDLTSQLRPHIDGVILQHGQRGATFLPQVWEQLPEPGTFLTHLCRKAGLAGDLWVYGHPDIKIYQVQSFAEGKK